MNKIIEFYPAYDKRHPDPFKNYGIGSVSILFLLKGDKGAVQFKLLTGWYLPELGIELDNPMPADLGYHSPIPIYDGQKSIPDNCEWLDGECYYDGSTTASERIYEILLKEGSDGVWRELEKYYEEIFNR
jgi:hypothetical protein